jgi:hypothetical protein
MNCECGAGEIYDPLPAGIEDVYFLLFFIRRTCGMNILRSSKKNPNLAFAHDANQDARDLIRSPATISQSKAVEVKPCSETRACPCLPKSKHACGCSMLAS